MIKETCDFTKLEAVRWIYNNNPGKVYVHHYDCMNRPVLVVSKVPTSELKFPDEWYYDENNGITCKKNPSHGFLNCYNYIVKIIQK